MKSTSVLLILLILFSCGSARRGTKGVITYRFNGQVSIKTSDCVPNLKKVLPLKSRLTLMKQDSTIITETTTDSLGNFDTMVAIDTSWNPLLLKVDGLEDYYLDRVINKDYTDFRYDFLCSIIITDSIRFITIDSSKKKRIEVDCMQEEHIVNDSSH